MKGNAFFVTFWFIGLFPLQSISIGYAQDRNPAGWPEQVWTMLLRTDGWIDYYSGCPHSGESMITFEARGQKFVAIIQNPGVQLVNVTL
jgi:hypothetical protein